MKKKHSLLRMILLSFFAVLFSLFLVPGKSVLADGTDLNTVYSAYRKVLTKYESKMRTIENTPIIRGHAMVDISNIHVNTCSLTDVTGDGIPELIILYCSDDEQEYKVNNDGYFAYADMRIFTVASGQTTATQLFYLSKAVSFNSQGSWDYSDVVLLSNGGLFVKKRFGGTDTYYTYIYYALYESEYGLRYGWMHDLKHIWNGDYKRDEYLIDGETASETEFNSWIDVFKGEFSSVLSMSPYYLLNKNPSGWEKAVLNTPNKSMSFDDAMTILNTIKTGWVKEGKNWYYYTNGKKATSWKKLNGAWYYFNSKGVMQTGWKQIDGVWYYFRDSGSMFTGWYKSGSTWYYLKDSGAMATGWQQVGSTWYYFDGNGAMKTGWVQSGNTWYYMTESGAMATGWKSIGGKWYYFESSGAMKTGWLQLGKTWYYFDANGAMVTGNYKIDGKTNKFSSSGAWIGYA